MRYSTGANSPSRESPAGVQASLQSYLAYPKPCQTGAKPWIATLRKPAAPTRYSTITASLKSLLAEISSTLAERTSADSACQLLQRLSDRLSEHFILEEQGGYFAEAMMRSPHLIARANGLMAQHDKLRTAAEEAARLAAAERQAGEFWEAARTRFEALRQSLLNHESGEDSLLQEAYVQDLGASD